jgi:high-affinity iron transporter
MVETARGHCRSWVDDPISWRKRSPREVTSVRRFARWGALVIAFSLACVVLTLGKTAWAEDEREQLAARLEHKLAYLSADYAMAATSTAAGDEGESDEHARLAAEFESKVGELALPPELSTSVTRVSSLVRRNAAASEVAAAVEEARAVLIANVRLPVAPTAQPDAAHGRALFEQYCASCHGMTGRGDTEKAASLKPRPANFLDPSIGEPLSPYRITTTVRFGVDGTAMVPFGFLSEADRWDVAFYAMGLRHVAPVAEEGPLYDVAELAILSDEQLRAGMRAGGVGEASVEPVLTELRRRAPYGSWRRDDALTIARGELTRAREDLYRGKRDLALAAVRRAERNGLLPAEAALRSLDPELARTARSGWKAVVARIQGGASARDAGLAITSLLEMILRAQRALWHAYLGHNPVSSAVYSGLLLVFNLAGAVLVIVILLALLARAGLAHERKRVHKAWGVALCLGLATSLLWGRGHGVPSAALDGARCGLSLLVAAGMIAVGRTQLVQPSAAVFVVPFAATYSDTFTATSLFRSIAACGMAIRPMLAGLTLGGAVLLLSARAYAPLAGRISARASRGISLSLWWALAVLFFGQATVALWSLASS